MHFLFGLRSSAKIIFREGERWSRVGNLLTAISLARACARARYFAARSLLLFWRGIIFVNCVWLRFMRITGKKKRGERGEAKSVILEDFFDVLYK